MLRPQQVLPQRTVRPGGLRRPIHGNPVVTVGHRQPGARPHDVEPPLNTDEVLALGQLQKKEDMSPQVGDLNNNWSYHLFFVVFLEFET